MTPARPAILLVDDVPANLVALEAQLGDLDCDIVRAGSGNEALRQLLKRPYAVMLLDVQMPHMDGPEVAKLARENPSTREVPVIFVTAMHGTEETILRTYGTGAVDLLHKPVNAYVLRSKVKVFLDLYRSRQRLADEIAAHKQTMADLEAYDRSVSHDLRAPLRHIDGYARILMEDLGPRLDGESKHHLERMCAATKRMAQLIDDLLRLSQVGSATVRVQPVDLAGIAREIFAELKRDDPSRDVQLEVTVSEKVEADPALLRIALANLLRNAWKFTKPRERARIEVGARDGAYFVKDDGVGFDPAYAGKLFRPFQRLHSSEFEGTGIGLAIVERIVRHHGGKIWAEGTVDQGATFSFTLG
jgi:two-component system, sensor histidine kinase and response regulator